MTQGVAVLKTERRFDLRKAIWGSLVLHALLLLFFFLYERLHETALPVPPPDLTWLQVSPDNERRVVQTEKTKKSDTVPKKAFLGEQNQEADRETVSRSRMTAAGGAATAGKSAQKKSAKSSIRAEASPLAKFGLPMVPTAQQEQKRAEEASAPEYAQFGSRPADFVPGVKEGDRTVLNTKEFVFYGYFQRIRERLDRAWVPLLRERIYKIYRSGRQLASDMDHTTRILVVLNNQGEIVKVTVLGESGSEDLDDAAVKAFNKAGPFPNPPSGIIGADGLVQIPWDFILKT